MEWNFAERARGVAVKDSTGKDSSIEKINTEKVNTAASTADIWNFAERARNPQLSTPTPRQEVPMPAPEPARPRPDITPGLDMLRVAGQPQAQQAGPVQIPAQQPQAMPAPGSQDIIRQLLSNLPQPTTQPQGPPIPTTSAPTKSALTQIGQGISNLADAFTRGIGKTTGLAQAGAAIGERYPDISQAVSSPLAKAALEGSLTKQPEGALEEVGEIAGRIAPYIVAGPLRAIVAAPTKAALTRYAPKLAGTALGRLIPAVTGTAALGGAVATGREAIKGAAAPDEFQISEALKEIGSDAARFGAFAAAGELVGKPTGDAIWRALGKSVQSGKVSPQLAQLIAAPGRGGATGLTLASVETALRYLKNPKEFDKAEAAGDMLTTTLFFAGMDTIFTLGSVAGQGFRMQGQARFGPGVKDAAGAESKLFVTGARNPAKEGYREFKPGMGVWINNRGDILREMTPNGAFKYDIWKQARAAGTGQTGTAAAGAKTAPQPAAARTEPGVRGLLPGEAQPQAAAAAAAAVRPTGTPTVEPPATQPPVTATQPVTAPPVAPAPTPTAPQPPVTTTQPPATPAAQAMQRISQYKLTPAQIQEVAGLTPEVTESYYSAREQGLPHEQAIAQSKPAPIPTENLLQEILKRGGIKPPMRKAKQEAIPEILQSKDGMELKDMAAALNMTERDLLKALQEPETEAGKAEAGKVGTGKVEGQRTGAQKVKGVVAPRSEFAEEDVPFVGEGKAGEQVAGKPAAAPATPITMRAYHGTDTDGIKAFDVAKAGTATDEGLLGAGVYFSTDKAVGSNKKNTIETDIKLKNPLTVTYPSWDANKSQLVSEALGLDRTLSGKELTAELQKRGYDGVVLDYSPVGYDRKEIVVFNPEQAKIVDSGGFKEKTPPVDTPPSLKRPVEEVKKENYRTPLSQYTDKLYHETNIENALRMTDPGIMADMTSQRLYFSNDPDLALGQGKNKGVLIELAAGNLQGQVNTDKPTWEAAYGQGSAEFIANLNKQTDYRNAAQSITVKPDAKGSKSDTIRLKNLVEGWKSVKNKDGSVTYYRPPAAEQPKAGAVEKGADPFGEVAPLPVKVDENLPESLKKTGARDRKLDMQLFAEGKELERQMFADDQNIKISSTKEMTPPEKTIKAYKLFRTLKNRPGEIFPLFIGKTEPTPMGKWVPAEFIPTKGYAYRPGWHAGSLPHAPHLMKKDGTMQQGRVWAEVEMPADKDWQPIADMSKTGDIRDKVPEGGHYRFKTPKMQGGEWVIGGAIKVNRLLTNKEVRQKVIDAGLSGELGYRTLEEAQLAFNAKDLGFSQWKLTFDEDKAQIFRYTGETDPYKAYGKLIAPLKGLPPKELKERRMDLQMFARKSGKEPDPVKDKARRRIFAISNNLKLDRDQRIGMARFLFNRPDLNSISELTRNEMQELADFMSKYQLQLKAADTAQRDAKKKAGIERAAKAKKELEKALKDEEALHERIKRQRELGYEVEMASDVYKLLGKTLPANFVDEQVGWIWDKQIYVPSPREMEKWPAKELRSLTKENNTFDQYLRPIYRMLPRELTDDGMTAKQIATAFQDKYLKTVNDVLQGFTEKERISTAAMLEGVLEKTGKEGKAADRLKAEFFDPLFDQAVKAGVLKETQYVAQYFSRLSKEVGKITGEPFTAPKRWFTHQRTGKMEDYKMDVQDVANIYINAMSKAIHIDPFLRKWEPEIRKMPKSKQSMAEIFITSTYGRPTSWETMMNQLIKDIYQKFNKELPEGMRPTQDISRALISAVVQAYMGFNPGSVIKNLTQKFLAVADVATKEKPLRGFKFLAQAQAFKATPAGREFVEKYCTLLKNRTFQEGLEKTARYEWKLNQLLDASSKVTMWGFRKADLSNVTDGFLIGLFAGLEDGKPMVDALWQGNDVALRTQFPYDVRKPMAFHNPVWRVAGLFASWPIHLFELSNDWLSAGGWSKLLLLAMLMGGTKYLMRKLGIHLQIGLLDSAQGHIAFRTASGEQGAVTRYMSDFGKIAGRLASFDTGEWVKAMEELAYQAPGGIAYKRMMRFYRASQDNWRLRDARGKVYYSYAKEGLLWDIFDIPGEAVRALIGQTTENYDYWSDRYPTALTKVEKKAQEVLARITGR